MTRYISAAETSYAGTVDWRQRAACRDDPDSFDMDVIRDDPAAIREALERCLACPALALCRAWTDQLVADKRPPQALVQAGEVYPDRQQRKHRRSPISGACSRGHERTPDSVFESGECKACKRERRARMAGARRT